MIIMTTFYYCLLIKTYKNYDNDNVLQSCFNEKHIKMNIMRMFYCRWFNEKCMEMIIMTMSYYYLSINNISKWQEWQCFTVVFWWKYTKIIVMTIFYSLFDRNLYECKGADILVWKSITIAFKILLKLIFKHDPFGDFVVRATSCSEK